MIPEMKWGVDMSDTEELCTKLALVKLNSIKEHKYGTLKQKT